MPEPLGQLVVLAARARLFGLAIRVVAAVGVLGLGPRAEHLRRRALGYGLDRAGAVETGVGWRV